MSVILITGANRGFGYETARQLHEQGHRVYIGARDPQQGEAAGAAIGREWVELDVRSDISVAAALGLTERREGRLDVLVNNAGVGAAELTERKRYRCSTRPPPAWSG